MINGTRFDKNVGADAHICPQPYGTSWYVEWDREMGCLYNISPFNKDMRTNHPARADVGIGPYNETFGAFHSPAPGF